MARPNMRRTSLVLALFIALVIGVFVRSRPAPVPPTTSTAPSQRARLAVPTWPIRLSTGEAAPLDHHAAPAEIWGRVLSSASGQGVANAELVFGQQNTVFTVNTDAQGGFHWVVPTPGIYQLTMITAVGHEPFAPTFGHSPVVFEAKPGVRLRDVTLFLSPIKPAPRAASDGGNAQGRIAGRVVDDRGNPQENALVVAVTDEGAVGRITTDSNGHFVVDNLTTGMHRLVASHPGWAPVTVENVAIGTNDVVLTLGRGGRIVGTVRDQDSGKPVVAFSIVAMIHKGAVERGDSVTSSFFSGDGHYQLGGVPAGTYSVVAIAHDHARSAEQTVTLANFTSEVRADFTLARGRTIKGRVVDAASAQGLPGARVSLENPFGADTSLPLPIVASAATDASGAFTLGGLSAGACSLFVTAEGHHSRMVPGVRTDDSITVDLTATQPGEEARIESAGINAAVQADGDRLLIQRVSPGGGADLAGIKDGDIIVRVAGVAVTELGMQAAVEHLRGPPGTIVVVTLRRPPSDANFDLTVERRRIINR